MIRTTLSGSYKTFLTMLAFLCLPSTQFNIDDTHSTKFHPSIDPNTEQLFGYSVSTIETDSNSFLVGAPRSKNDNGVVTGHIYKCTVGSNACQRMKFDFKDSIGDENMREEMFGASIVQLDEDQLVACAPRYKVKKSSDDSSTIGLIAKFPTGRCYVRKKSHMTTLPMNELSLFENQIHTFSNAQVGTSIQKNRENDVIFGAPGLRNWKGGAYIWRNSLSGDKFCTFKDYNFLENFSYFGYSVMGLHVRNETYFAIGGPRSKDYGEVQILHYRDPCHIYKRTQVEIGEFGSYFGHSLGRVDVEGDGEDELVVGAPFSNQSLGDEGRVYVFKLREENKWKLEYELRGGSVEGGRYGWLVNGVGDVDFDGFEELLVTAPLEGQGVAYLYYGRKDGFSESRVQRMELGMISAFASIKDSNGYPRILTGISKSDIVVLLNTRPVHSLQVNISVASVLWTLHSCSLLENTARVVASVSFSYSVPETEFNSSQYKNMIDDLRYKVVLDNRGYFELQFDNSMTRQTNENKKRKHETEGELDFLNSKPLGSLSISIPLMFPYKIMPDNVETPIKMTLFVIESERKFGPMLHTSQNKEFSVEMNFKKKCFTKTCKPALKFWLEHKSIPLTLGYQQESAVRGFIGNDEEPAFISNFTFVHPRWASLKSITADPPCFVIECKRAQAYQRLGYVEERCKSQEALMNTTIEVVFLLTHSIDAFESFTENEVVLQNDLATFEPYYNSLLTVINTSSDSFPLHKTPPQSTFSTTHFYDVRTNSTHPSFQLRIQEPLGAFEDDVCCLSTKISVIFKAGSNNTILTPKLVQSSEKPSLASFLNATLKNSSTIKLSCLSCSPWSLNLSSLNNSQSVDVAISTNISGKLLIELQRSTTFAYHTHLLLTPIKVISARRFLLSPLFNSTTGVYEVISLSLAATKAPSTPFWLVFACIFVGIFGVMLLVLLLKKCGFFRREKRATLKEKARISKLEIINEEESNNENINVDEKDNESKNVSSNDLQSDETKDIMAE